MKWEYKFITRMRQWSASAQDSSLLVANDWTVWAEDGKALPGPVDIVAKATEAGEQGWELATVTPRSSYGSSSLAGMVTEELWVFKRPKA
jgi:hypothetical protein